MVTKSSMPSLIDIYISTRLPFNSGEMIQAIFKCPFGKAFPFYLSFTKQQFSLNSTRMLLSISHLDTIYRFLAILSTYKTSCTTRKSKISEGN